ncbi:type VI secretion system baseplate subunit TssE [Campylobacter jejuni]|uniref:Type VI secretion system baseplate subunit TssE n=1 Tax=Campylobacter jejuni TaxID=197 RepID=A0A430X4D3_CAMJU|nr:type VI secretion system baseplate subunit TssE [Campylobacter jejuni]MEA8951486.1 type VI secretion system baseplate subunit TssE [Campylobacter jejuni]RTI80579.1 type VI secretion system baseplate subunit TssE [Campylobacter jejuni]RTI91286.1 type VI secretion system baseplate subunit TssE [Campylobacter jejuni]RTJ20082.1 type VI secretion system baseplate subunit TssE [Campylobacter jejuni]RTJ30384.1 type VI secretion system baseplate subunit TssE [Campylobacter jejuni]
MSLLDKLIHELDDQNTHVPFYQNDFEDVKNNIKVLLNSKINDCYTAKDLGMPNMTDINLSSSELCISMAKEIRKLIDSYEKRIRVVSIAYDNSLSPWQLSFIAKCFFQEDRFKEFSIEIIFKNNRYCEVK